MSRTAHALKRPRINSILRAVPSAHRALLDAAAAAADGRGEALWLVGGAVRDYAAGLPAWNVDVSVDGDPAALAALAALPEHIGRPST